jgi:8-oxo-dGTP diphosphatase
MAIDAGLLIAVAVVEHEGHYLIGPRPEGVPLAGLWEFPGGKVEPGETAEQAAQRECLEETGIAITVGEAYPAVDHQYEHGHVRLIFFACRPLDPICVPRRPFEWVPRSRLAEYRFPDANAALIAHLTAG